jgi:hypothetical protein
MSSDVTLKIESLNDWRGDLLARVRSVILDSAPGIVEEVKWRKASNPLGVPTWSRNGIICTGESYKDKVKLTFMHGNALRDPHNLFTDEPTGTRRAIDFRQGGVADLEKLRCLIIEAVSYNARDLLD